MANEKQLKILKEGVSVWNRWRDDNPKTEIDLSDSNLSNTYLSDANFYEADLTRVIFSDPIHFHTVQTDDNDILYESSELFGADLSNIDFSSACLYKAKLRHAELENSNFQNADLSYSNLEYTDFNNACLKGTQLIEAITNQTSFVKTDLSGADISGAMIKDINNAKWIIKNIKCTHIFKDGKRIDYAEGEFEKAYTQIENLIEMIIDIPFSDFTYYVGRIIEEAANNKHKASLLFKTQTALSNNTTKFEFISFSENEKLDEIKTQLFEIQRSLKPVIEEAQTKNDPKNIIGIKDEIDILLVPGLVARPKEINRILVERYNAISPFLQQIINTIQSVFQ